MVKANDYRNGDIFYGRNAKDRIADVIAADDGYVPTAKYIFSADFRCIAYRPSCDSGFPGHGDLFLIYICTSTAQVLSVL